MKKKIRYMEIEAYNIHKHITVVVSRSHDGKYEPSLKIYRRVTPSSAIRTFCAILKMSQEATK